MQNTALQSPLLSAKHAWRDGAEVLRQAGIDTALLDARLLLQHSLDVSREQLLASDIKLTAQQQDHYRSLIEKRAARQPVSHVIGKREFWGMEFKVTAATLDPRPDSETLIAAVLEKFRDRKAKLRILDLGTGTGCLLLALLKEYENAEGVGVDISEDALKIAQENAEKLGMQQRASFMSSRWAENVKGTFDIVISNPPYIPTGDIAGLQPEVAQHEPKLALDGGADGLDCYREIIPRLKSLLAENGLAALEIGMGQEEDVKNIATAQGLPVTAVKLDMAGIPRCVLITH